MPTISCKAATELAVSSQWSGRRPTVNKVAVACWYRSGPVVRTVDAVAEQGH
jgi:hypothetical protein